MEEIVEGVHGGLPGRVSMSHLSISWKRSRKPRRDYISQLVYLGRAEGDVWNFM